MGWHECEYCSHESAKKNAFNHLSSGDVTLIFTNGRAWQMPDMILHYVGDHNWLPPQKFISDIMNEELARQERIQTRGLREDNLFQVQRIGYLSGPLATGNVPVGFLERLEKFTNTAGNLGYRVQTNSLNDRR
jgi:hypothetical protein